MFGIRVNWITVVLLVLLVFLQYRLWFEAGGIVDMMQMKTNLAKQQEETEKLKKNNEVLVAQIKRLQKSEDSTEAHARNELGMIKKGETFYQMVGK